MADVKLKSGLDEQTFKKYILIILYKNEFILWIAKISLEQGIDGVLKDGLGIGISR